MAPGYFLHPTALVESDQIGEGTSVWAYAHILKGAVVGRETTISDFCFVESGAVIGSFVNIKNNNCIWDGITIEDGVFIGPNVTFTNDRYPRSRKYKALPRHIDGSWLEGAKVGKNASIGGGSIILPGVKIGACAMIAAGSLVTRNVLPHALMVGSPAKQKGWVCECGMSMDYKSHNELQCPTCKTSYSVINGDKLEQNEVGNF